MNPFNLICTLVLLSGSMSLMSQAILVQPHNYMLDDSSILGPNLADASSFSHFLRDHADSDSQQQQFRAGRASSSDESAADSSQDLAADNSGEPSLSHFSAEMAELIQNEQRERAAAAAASGRPAGEDQAAQSLTASMAHVLMNVAQAAADEAAAAASASANDESSATGSSSSQSQSSSSMNQNEQRDASSANGAGDSLINSKSGPSKAFDYFSKTGPLWYNPKETIPVLKISSMGK